MAKVITGIGIFHSNQEIPKLPTGYVEISRDGIVIVGKTNGQEQFIVVRNPNRLVPILERSKNETRCDFGRAIIL